MHRFYFSLEKVLLLIQLVHIFFHKSVNVNIFVARAFCCLAFANWTCTFEVRSLCWARVRDLRRCTLRRLACPTVAIFARSTRVFLLDCIHFVFFFFQEFGFFFSTENVGFEKLTFLALWRRSWRLRWSKTRCITDYGLSLMIATLLKRRFWRHLWLRGWLLFLKLRHRLWCWSLSPMDSCISRSIKLRHVFKIVIFSIFFFAVLMNWLWGPTSN